MGSIGTTAALNSPPALPERDVKNLRGGHEVQFNVTSVGPPSNLYIGVDDLLNITLAGLTAASVLLEMRILTTQGIVIIDEELLTAPNSRTPATKQFRLPEGFILSISLQSQSAALARGTLYATIGLIRSQGPAVTYTYNLAQGYIGLLSPLYWPNPRTDTPTNSAGLPAGLAQAAPAVGSDWTYTPATLLRQRVQSIAAALTTSAVVANRQVTIQVLNGANIIYQAPAPSVQAASLTVTYSFVPGLSSIAVLGGLVVLPLPPGLIINSTMSVRTVTGAIDVGDQWSTIKVGTEDWIDQ